MVPIRVPPNWAVHHLIIPAPDVAPIFVLALQFTVDGLAVTFVGLGIGVTRTEMLTLLVLLHKIAFQDRTRTPFPLLYPWVWTVLFVTFKSVQLLPPPPPPLLYAPPPP